MGFIVCYVVTQNNDWNIWFYWWAIISIGFNEWFKFPEFIYFCDTSSVSWILRTFDIMRNLEERFIFEDYFPLINVTFCFDQRALSRRKNKTHNGDWLALHF